MDGRAWILAAVLGSGQPLEQVVVTVNGHIITRTEIDERVRVGIAQDRGQAISPRDLRDDPQLRAQAAAWTPRFLRDAIDELLVVQWARERGLDAGEDDVDRVIARMRLDNGIATEEAFAALLLGEGLSPASLRDAVRRQVSVATVRRQESARVLVRDSEARDYYRLHPAEFVSAPTVTFREILIALPGPDRDRLTPSLGVTYDEGLVRFVSAHERVRRGEDFSLVARAVSEGRSRDEGGAMGPMSVVELPPPVRDALARLADGEVSAPVRVDAGYVLLKMEHSAAAVPPTFEAWRTEVVRRVQDGKQARAFTARLHDLRAQAVIQWKDRTLEAAYAALRSSGGLAP